MGNSNYDLLFGGGGGTGTSSGGGGYTGEAPTAKATARIMPGSTGTDDTQRQYAFTGPGEVDFSMVSPFESAQDTGQQFADFFKGAKAVIFGTEGVDNQGKHGGVVGDIPVVGDLLRFGFGIPGGIGDVVGGGIKVVGEAAERIPLGSLDPAAVKTIEDQFAALPADSAARLEAEKQIAEDGGLLGTGFFNSHLTAMSKAIQKYNDEEAKTPDLYGNLFRPSASLADTFANLFGTFVGMPVRTSERLVAGAGRFGDEGLNQMEMIRAVGNGEAVWTSDSPGLTPVEQHAFDMTEKGEWTDAQALDYIASHGAGFSHNKALEIAASVALDPTILAGGFAGAVARLGRTGAKVLSAAQDVDKALDAARLAGDAAEVRRLEALGKEILSGGVKWGADAKSVAEGGNIAGRNVLARAGNTTLAGAITRAAGRGYVAAGNTWVGRVAKLTRTMVDPLHVIGANPKPAAAIEEGSHEIARIASEAYHGALGAQALEHGLAAIPQIGRTGGKEIDKGFAIFAANMLRKHAGIEYRASNLLGRTAEQLREFKVGDAISGFMSNIQKRQLQRLEERISEHVWRVMPAQPDLENLAQRAATMYKGLTKEEWLAEFAKNPKLWNPERLSYLHAATYGTYLSKLDEARQAVKLNHETGHWADRVNDIITVNKQTLTDLGHEGIMQRLQAAPNIEAKMAEIEQAMRDYPQLRNFPLDATSNQRTINEFEEMMDRIKETLPAQIRNAERANLAPSLRALDEETRDVFTLALRPPEEHLWGLARGGDGIMREVSDPWVDTVTDNINAYSASRELAFNAAGKPLPKVLQTSAKLIDRIEGIGRMARHGVTGKMVAVAARNRFTQGIAKDFKITEDEAKSIFEVLEAEVIRKKGYSGIRGLGEETIWEKAGALIPSRARVEGLDRRTLLVRVLEAYNGDLRTVGLTQAFTGRAKTFYGKLTGANHLGEIAEHWWPTLRFRFNAMFQIQEKLEPWVLGAWRGSSLAIRGSRMTEADFQMMQMVRNLTERNIVHWADNDIAEYAKGMGLGSALDDVAKADGSKTNRFMRAFRGASNVQGIKQLNMLRTMQKGLGKEMRAAWDQFKPGEWDEMLKARQVKMGQQLSDDDFAVMLAAENLDANKILVQRIVDSKTGEVTMRANFVSAMRVGEWAAPQNLGELQSLQIDGLIPHLGMVDNTGRAIETQHDLRVALASNKITMEQVKENLRLLSADPDYISRFESALTFSWTKFFGDVQETFGLTPAQTRQLENYFGRIAERSGMTPVEYISQVYSPQITNNGAGAVGSLGAIVEFMRGGERIELPDLAQLTGRAGESTIQDLYAQMGRITAEHLHPSAKAKFLHHLQPQLEEELELAGSSLNFEEIAARWTDDVQDELMRRIIRFNRGAPGEGEFTPIMFENEGVAHIRDLAQGWLADGGRPRNLQRGTIAYNDALGTELAADIAARPRYIHAVTDAENAHVVTEDTVNQLRVRGPEITTYSPGNEVREINFNQLGQRDRAALRTFVSENRALYTHLIDNGWKIKPVRSARPYATASAMRRDLARKTIKVPQAGHGHPVLAPEDVFMQRAVHDIFGYGQERLEFGDHNADMLVAMMYTDDARRVPVTEFAHRSWERHTPDVIQNPPAVVATADDYRARFGERIPRTSYSQGDMRGFGSTYTPETRTIGPGVERLPPEVQEELLGAVARWRSQFPDVPIGQIDVREGALIWDGTAAATVAYGDAPPSVVFDVGWEMDAAKRLENRTRRREFITNDRELGAVPFTVSGTPMGDVYHELGHALDVHLHDAWRAANPGKPVVPGVYLDKKFTKFMAEFRESEASKFLSRYAHTEVGHDRVSPLPEVFSELADLALNPDNAYLLSRHAEELPDELIDAAEDFVAHLKRMGVYKPEGSPAPVNPNAGRTIAEVNAESVAAGRGPAIAAERRAGFIESGDGSLLDRVTREYIGTGRFAESDPDVARMSAFLHQHMSEVIEETMEAGGRGRTAWTKFLDGASGHGVTEAVPFDLTQSLVRNGMMQAMANKFDDAFRLQYFQQSRSMFQRSVNHPLFGLYPASYMFGKIMPEMIKFVAREPFGVRTGLMGMTLLDLQKAIKVQRDYDPEFDKMMEKVGTNAALTMLAYMVPTTPWSTSAALPNWARDIAAQGLSMDQAAARGETLPEMDWISPLKKVIQRLSPYETSVPWWGRVGEAARGVYAPEQEETTTNTLGLSPENARALAPESPLQPGETVTGADLGTLAQDWASDLRDVFK